MKVTEVKDISSLEDGELVMRVEGEVTKAYERKAGSKDNKDWAVQNLFLKDETGEIKLSVWDHPDLQGFVHKKVSITAHKSDKGYTGVYVKDDEWKQKVTRILRLTATAQIQVLNRDMISLGPKPDADSSHVQAPSARPNTQRVSTPPPEQQNDSTGGADSALGQVGNALYKVMEATKHRWEQMIVDGLVPEGTEFFGTPHFQADCSIAWGYLKDRGLVDKLHTAPIWREAKKSALLDEEF